MPSLLDRFLGCMLGHAVGDAVAAPYEGLDAQTIYYNFGSTRSLVEEPLQAELCYTDDTQLSIAVAETLVDCREIDEESLCRAFVANYDPARGYGQGARRIIEAMGTGGDWRALSRSLFPGGSFGNGAAMRAAPVGLLFHDDLERVAAEARRSALPTHVHPVGIEGAQLIALAVAIALRERPFKRTEFFAELFGYARTETFQRQLARAAEMSDDDPVDVFGNSLPADESVVTALACFAGDPDSYPAVIARAIRVGNDTDTIAAMAGAICGARLGIAAVPARLIEKLENGPKGRDYIRDLAERLQNAFHRGSALIE